MMSNALHFHVGADFICDTDQVMQVSKEDLGAFIVIQKGSKNKRSTSVAPCQQMLFLESRLIAQWFHCTETFALPGKYQVMVSDLISW